MRVHTPYTIWQRIERVILARDLRANGPVERCGVQVPKALERQENAIATAPVPPAFGGRAGAAVRVADSWAVDAFGIFGPGYDTVGPLALNTRKTAVYYMPGYFVRHNWLKSVTVISIFRHLLLSSEA